MTNIEMETYSMVKSAARKYLDGKTDRLNIAANVLPSIIIKSGADNSVSQLCELALNFADELIKQNNEK